MQEVGIYLATLASEEEKTYATEYAEWLRSGKTGSEPSAAAVLPSRVPTIRAVVDTLATIG